MSSDRHRLTTAAPVCDAERQLLLGVDVQLWEWWSSIAPPGPDVHCGPGGRGPKSLLLARPNWNSRPAADIDPKDLAAANLPVDGKLYEL